MRTSFWTLTAVCLAPVIVSAADPQFDQLTVGDDTYRDVTVTSVTATDVYFTHAQGMGNAKLKDLEPDVQRQFDFDPDKAADVEARRKDGAAVYSALMQYQRKVDFQRAEEARQREAQLEALRAQQQAANSQPSDGLVNQPAPKMEVERWLTRQPNLKGKFVLVDFWATWCGPCRSSIPHLNNLHEKFSDRLVIVGLSAESPAEVRQLKTPTIRYYSAVDQKARMAREVGVTQIPHALLIDPEGIVRYQGHPVALSEQVMAALLDRFGA